MRALTLFDTIAHHASQTPRQPALLGSQGELDYQSLWQQKKQKIREVFLHRREEKHQPDPIPLYGVILSTAAIIMAEMKMQDARTVIMGKTDRRTS